MLERAARTLTKAMSFGCGRLALGKPWIVLRRDSSALKRSSTTGIITCTAVAASANFPGTNMGTMGVKIKEERAARH